MLIGAFFGILPDFDLVLSPLWGGAHRSVGSHSLLAATLIAIAWYAAARFLMDGQGLVEFGDLLAPSAVVAFAASFIHALEDSFTKQGCRLLYPLSRRRWRGPVCYDDLLANTILSIVAVALILLSVGRGGLLS